jgi:hypothetical protein
MRMDTMREISGLPFDDGRFAELVEKYRPILREIEKLRSLELKDVHPVIHFDPTVAYRARSMVQS